MVGNQLLVSKNNTLSSNTKTTMYASDLIVFSTRLTHELVCSCVVGDKSGGDRDALGLKRPAQAAEQKFCS